MNKLFRISLVFILLFALSTTGCEPLRKKFVRKKKTTSDPRTDIVFDPFEYPVDRKSTAQRYRQHYDMWKVWENDLVVIVDEATGDRKAKYTLEQMQLQMNEMKYLLKDDFQKDADDCLKKIYVLIDEFDKPGELRNKAKILSDIRALDRKVRKSLSLEHIKDQLIETPMLEGKS